MGSGAPKPKGPPLPRSGRTVAGQEHVTTMTCPACEAQMTTVGAGYPQVICCRCSMPMVAKSKKVGN